MVYFSAKEKKEIKQQIASKIEEAVLNFYPEMKELIEKNPGEFLKTNLTFFNTTDDSYAGRISITYKLPFDTLEKIACRMENIKEKE